MAISNNIIKRENYDQKIKVEEAVLLYQICNIMYNYNIAALNGERQIVFRLIYKITL